MNSNSTAGRGVAAGRRRGRQFRRGLGLGRETLARLGTERRGAVALIVALVLPVLLGVVALALEVGSWATARIDVQRQADIAAMTAAVQYANGAPSATSIALQSTLSNASIAAGTSLAAVNGVTAANNASLVLVQVAGVKTTPDTNVAFKAVTSRQMSLGIGKVLSTLPSVTVSATAIAEISGAAGGGGQPCIFSTNTTAGATSFTISGGPSRKVALGTSGCTVRSNNGFSISSQTAVQTEGVYSNQSVQPTTKSILESILGASSAIISDSGSVALVAPDTSSGTWANSQAWPINWSTGVLGANPEPTLLDTSAAPISDPYQSDSSYLNAIQNLTNYMSGTQPTSNTAITKAGTYNGGSYNSISLNNGSQNNATLSGGTYYISGNVNVGGGTTLTLGPGTYYVGGNFNVSNGGILATTSGTANLTIVANGTISFSSLQSNSTVSLSAPTSGSSSGIPGYLFISNSSQKGSSCAICFTNANATFDLGGLIYAPKGQINITNGVSIKSTESCLQMAANSVLITGGTQALGIANCNQYYPGLPSYSSVQGSLTAALVR